MIQNLIDALPPDPWRVQAGFSPDIQACHEVLFRPDASRPEMEDALNRWLAEHQPCLFGRMEARQGRLSYCLLTERDLLRGDDHVRARILADRSTWRERAFRGGSHGFIIVAISRRIAMAAVGPQLLQLARHLCLLYLSRNDLDQQFHDRVRLVIEDGETREYRRWKVGVNFFAPQGDGRWWRDHRFPGGMAYSMNSVGHMAHYRAIELLRRSSTLASRVGDVPRDRLVYWALPTAMRTIGPPLAASTRGTWLEPWGRFPEDLEPPTYEVRQRVFGDLAEYSQNRYIGTYHTDETIPSPYFDPNIRTLESAPRRDDLYFTYLHSTQDPDYLTMGIGKLVQAIEEEEEQKNDRREK